MTRVTLYELLCRDDPYRLEIFTGESSFFSPPLTPARLDIVALATARLDQLLPRRDWRRIVLQIASDAISEMRSRDCRHTWFCIQARDCTSV